MPRPRAIPVDADDPRPFYIRIMETLRRQILSGEVGERLTGEIELARKLGASRGTVQEAINGLVREGFLRRRRGSGTFVVHDRVESYYREISSFTSAMEAQGLAPVVHLHRFVREAPTADTARALRLQPDDGVFLYSRSVSLDGTPIVFTESFMPASRFPDLAITAPQESLYRMLRQGFGATPSWARDVYTPELASGQVAEALGMEEGVPLFRVERLTLDQGRTPIELAVSWFRKGRLAVEISPMSLFLEERFFSSGPSISHWHHQVSTEY